MCAAQRSIDTAVRRQSESRELGAFTPYVMCHYFLITLTSGRQCDYICSKRDVCAVRCVVPHTLAQHRGYIQTGNFVRPPMTRRKALRVGSMPRKCLSLLPCFRCHRLGSGRLYTPSKRDWLEGGDNTSSRTGFTLVALSYLLCVGLFKNETKQPQRTGTGSLRGCSYQVSLPW